MQQAHQQAVRRAANLSPALQPGIGRMGMEALKECEDGHGGIEKCKVGMLISKVCAACNWAG
eukprot:1137030-Pelagomonas_calceolata.AAC.5